MAVQQNKKSPSRRGMRRSHHSLAALPAATDSASGSRHLRHHVSADGYYRGRRVTEQKPDAEKEE